MVCASDRHSGLAPIAKKLGVAAVETLGSHHDGTILDLAKTQSSDFADVTRAADDLD